MSYTIRQATTADVPALVEIIRTAFRDVALRFDLTAENCPKHPFNCRESWIASALEKGVRYFILASERGSCGCVALEQANRETCYLERLAVLPPISPFTIRFPFRYSALQWRRPCPQDAMFLP